MNIETNSRKIIARLEAEGWTLASTQGSHHKFPKQARTVVVPHPRKDIAPGTARKIAKDAGWV